MRRIIPVIAFVALSLCVSAGEYDLLWDYLVQLPSSNPDRGLYYDGKSDDGLRGIHNRLNGIKLNSAGYAYFRKAPVAGWLRLGYGDRSTYMGACLKIYTWPGELADKPTSTEQMTLITTTESLTEYGLVTIPLSAEQQNIYITRGNEVETILPYIRFQEGPEPMPEPCRVIVKDLEGQEILREAVPEGSVFRGWCYNNGRKVQIGDEIHTNTTLRPLITPREVAAVGTVQHYDFASPAFYPEDHELLRVTKKGLEVLTDGLKALVLLTTDDGQQTMLRTENKPSLHVPAKMERIRSLSVYFVQSFVERDSTGVYRIPAGDAASFLYALAQANTTGEVTIFLPNGVYDLGETTLTPIRANGITILGESRAGTIIRNAPSYLIEQINTTATLKILDGVENTRLENLTIRNDLDYYRNDQGRGVCLWDQGTKTICRNVCLFSHQDTYYSDRVGGLKYFEDCEIHGTVDFICGNGNVYFYHTDLVCEARQKSGGGVDYITASNAAKEDEGYVFVSCRVRYGEIAQGAKPTVSFGRSWNNSPKCVFINTILDGVRMDTRWTLKGMRVLPERFGEYHSTDNAGKEVSPQSNKLTFHLGATIKTMETILSGEQAAQFTIDNILGLWSVR